MAFDLPCIGQGMARAQQIATGDWRDDDVERWLTDNPLPADFNWNNQRVYPLKGLITGYGQWLRTAGSYHPALRGLFRLCCDVLVNLPVGVPMPSPSELAVLLKAEAERRLTVTQPETQLKPIGNPTPTDREPSF